MSAHCCVDRSDQQMVNDSVTQSVIQEAGYRLRVVRTAKNTAYRKHRKELARSASNDLPRLFRSDARSECTSASFSLALQNHNMIILQIWGRQLSEIINHIQDKGNTFLKCVVSSVRSSNSHPDLLLIQHPHFFRSHRSSTQDFHFLSHCSYKKAIMLYKGNHWT